MLDRRIWRDYTRPRPSILTCMQPIVTAILSTPVLNNSTHADPTPRQFRHRCNGPVLLCCHRCGDVATEAIRGGTIRDTLRPAVARPKSESGIVLTPSHLPLNSTHVKQQHQHGQTPTPSISSPQTRLSADASFSIRRQPRAIRRRCPTYYVLAIR